MSEPERRKAICRECSDRPAGCWKAMECGCNSERERLFVAATGCPLGKWYSQLDLRTVDGLIYTAPGRFVRYHGLSRLQIHTGEQFGRHDFRVRVAHDYGRLLQFRRAPFLLLEDDCVARGPVGLIGYPPDAELIYLGGGMRGVGNAHRKHDAKQWRGYSYLDFDSLWLRIWGMLYTHALLFVGDRAIQLVSEAFKAATRPGDQLTAILQHELVTYCLRKPLFIQATNDQTWDYEPRDLQPFELRHNRVDEIRQRRRLALAR